MKRVLIISPTPTHSTNAGNRIRILRMADFLIKNNYEVHFLYSNQEEADIEAMKNYWGPHFYVVNYEQPSLFSVSKIMKRAMGLFIENYRYYSGIDDHYNMNLDKCIEQLQQKVTFDIVIAEYIFLSIAFKNFPSSVLKIIDTHDVMTDRHKTFLSAGKKPEWYSVSKQQEKEALDRADVIIAIQKKESDFFKKMTKRKIGVVGHMVDIHPPLNTIPRKRILFIGSNNPNNYHGLMDFIERIFPAIHHRIPDMEFYIAGKICDSIENRKGMIKIGEVTHIKEAYDYADIVINPLTFGTGLKIKTIEALGYSKVVISSLIGVEGLENGIGTSFIVAHSPEQWLSSIMEVLNSPTYFRQLVEKAKTYAEVYNKEVGKELLHLMSLKSAVHEEVGGQIDNKTRE